MPLRPDRPAMLRAYLQVLGAGALWATSGPFSIALHRMGVPPASVALLRPAVGGVLLGLLLLTVGRQQLRVDRGPLAAMLLGGGLIVGVFQLAYQMSTAAIGVPATVALLYLSPAFVLAASAVLFAERPTPARCLLAMVSVIGVWLAVLGARGVDVILTPTGLLWGTLCGVSYAAYTLFGKGLSGAHGALVPLFWSTLGGSAILALVAVARREPLVLPPTVLAWAVLILFGALTIAASALLLFNALRTLDAGRAVIGTTIEPLIAALLALVLLDQILTPIGWMGLCLLMGGVIGAYALPPAATERGMVPRGLPLGPWSKRRRD